VDNAILLAAVVETATARANLAGLDAAAEQSAAKLSIVDAAAQGVTTASEGLQASAAGAGQQVTGAGNAARQAAGSLLEMAASSAGASSGAGVLLSGVAALAGGGGLVALALAAADATGLTERLGKAFFDAGEDAQYAYDRARELFEEVARFEGKDFATEFYFRNISQAETVARNLDARLVRQRGELQRAQAQLNAALGSGRTPAPSSPVAGVQLGSFDGYVGGLRRQIASLNTDISNTLLDIGNVERRLSELQREKAQQARYTSAGATSPEEREAQEEAERARVRAAREAERARIRAQREADRAAARAQRFGDQQERIQADSIGRTALQAERADHERHMTRIAGIADEDQKRREGIAEEYRYAVAVAGLARQAAERENAAANVSAATRAQRNAQARTQQEADVAEAARRQAEATADLNDDIADRQARATERQGREQEQRDREAFRARKDAADRQFDVDQQRIRQGVQAGMVAVEVEKRGIADASERRVFEIYATEMLAREASERLLAAEEKRITATYAEGAEREQRLAVVRAENQTRLGEAEAKRVASTADLEERVGRQAFERAQRRIRQAETLAGRVASRGLDAVEDALRGTRRLSETEVEIQRDRFAEEEKALKKSLRNREIDQRRFNLEMRRLAEERADYDKRVEQERTGVLGALGRGLVDLLIDEGKRLIAGYIAQGAVRLAISLGLMKSAEAASAASMYTIAAAAANAATLVSIATGGAAAATGTAGVLAGMAAVKAASIVGQFESGGFTGWGGRRQVAGVVHGREFVMPADVVERDGPGPWYALMARIRAGSRLGDALGMAGVPQLYSGGYVMPSVPSDAYVPAPVYDDTRLVATGQATNARLDRLSRAVDALANRPTTYVVGDADARRQRYAAEREARRVDPRRRL